MTGLVGGWVVIAALNAAMCVVLLVTVGFWFSVHSFTIAALSGYIAWLHWHHDETLRVLRVAVRR